MKTTLLPPRYALLTTRLDQLWFPAAFWALFVLLAWIMRLDRDAAGLAAGFLGCVLPLIGGVMAAYAVLDDPALELHFASARPAWVMLAERLGAILAVIAAAALTYQLAMAGLGISLAGLGAPLARQLAWLAPSLALMALSIAAALAVAQTTPAAMIVGFVWILQILLRGWFASARGARYVYLFMGALSPAHPSLPANQASLLLLSLLLLAAAVLLLKQQERYI